ADRTARRRCCAGRDPQMDTTGAHMAGPCTLFLATPRPWRLHHRLGAGAGRAPRLRRGCSCAVEWLFAARRSESLLPATCQGRLYLHLATGPHGGQPPRNVQANCDSYADRHVDTLAEAKTQHFSTEPVDGDSLGQDLLGLSPIHYESEQLYHQLAVA